MEGPQPPKGKISQFSALVCPKNPKNSVAGYVGSPRWNLFFRVKTLLITNVGQFSLIFTDTSLRNIIDKLAEFVARNGPEFETMTKAKQKGNPKFEFLYGGEFYQYYQYKIASEQACE
jgi:Surp module